MYYLFDCLILSAVMSDKKGVFDSICLRPVNTLAIKVTSAKWCSKKKMHYYG